MKGKCGYTARDGASLGLQPAMEHIYSLINYAYNPWSVVVQWSMVAVQWSMVVA